jgi:hypothetical protein
MPRFQVDAHSLCGSIMVLTGTYDVKLVSSYMRDLSMYGSDCASGYCQDVPTCHVDEAVEIRLD